jgi:hypothetical protein
MRTTSTRIGKGAFAPGLTNQVVSFEDVTLARQRLLPLGFALYLSFDQLFVVKLFGTIANFARAVDLRSLN